jgi:hypothetical protein
MDLLGGSTNVALRHHICIVYLGVFITRMVTITFTSLPSIRDFPIKQGLFWNFTPRAQRGAPLHQFEKYCSLSWK